MGRIEAAINPMYCVPKRSDLSLIGSAFEAAGFRCVRIRTECEAEHRTKGGDPRRHGMLVLDGDRVILEVLRYGHEIEMYTVEQGEKRDKRQ